MTPLLRSRLAKIVLLASFVIPIGTSSLRGLTHVLTCRDEVRTPFSITVPEDGPPVVTTSLFLEQGTPDTACGGLDIDIRARFTEDEQLAVILPLVNTSRYDWQGSVQVRVGDSSVPLGIGRVAAGTTETTTIELDLPPGAHDITGSLLIGP